MINYIKETWNRTDEERSERNNDYYNRQVEQDRIKCSGNYVPPADVRVGILFWVAFLALLIFLVSKG